MFARSAHFRVKSLDLAGEFTLTLQNDVVPLLRRQAGFKGEITMSNPGSLERISISLWESKNNADAYDVNVYPQVLKMLSKVIDGGQKILIFESLALNLNNGAVERQ